MAKAQTKPTTPTKANWEKEADKHLKGVKDKHNAAFLSFPTDKWGLTKDIKKAIIAAAARTCGSEEKYDLFMATLQIATEHYKAKFTQEKKARDQK